jgi:hypothetical protein
MFTAYIAIAVLVSAAMTFSAFGLLTHQKQVLTQMDALRVPTAMMPFLATAEIAGTIGLIAGIWYLPLAIAAGSGVFAYFVGGVGAHLRVRDYKGAVPAAMLAIAAAAAIYLRVHTYSI